MLVDPWRDFDDAERAADLRRRMLNGEYGEEKALRAAELDARIRRGEYEPDMWVRVEKQVRWNEYLDGIPKRRATTQHEHDEDMAAALPAEWLPVYGQYMEGRDEAQARHQDEP